MKKQDLLKEAKVKFPKGTMYKSVTGIEKISNGNFYIPKYSNCIMMRGKGNGRLILGEGMELWATPIDSFKIKLYGNKNATINNHNIIIENYELKNSMSLSYSDIEDIYNALKTLNNE